MNAKRARRRASAEQFTGNPLKQDKGKTLKAGLKELAELYPYCGYLMLHNLLKREGPVFNKKRAYRPYKELMLQLIRRIRNKLNRPKLAMDIPEEPNLRRSMGFLFDRLSRGRHLKILSIEDDYSREAAGQLVEFSITGTQATRFLDQLKRTLGLPDAIVCDNGPEFTDHAMFFWSKRRAVKLSFIQISKLTQNAFAEILGGKFRNECLNRNWFRSVEGSRAIISGWRRHHNHVRPQFA